MADLDRQIERGARRLLDAEDSLYKPMAKALAETKERRDQLTRQAARAERESKLLDPKAINHVFIRGTLFQGSVRRGRADRLRIRGDSTGITNPR